MAKRPDDKQQSETDNEQNLQLADKIKESARQIWLAGLGAYTKAEEDTGRFFDRLVKEGEELESRTRGAVGRQIRSVEDRVEGVRERATGTWDRLEGIFDQRVSGALKRLGIPSHEELAGLRQRVEYLEKELAKLKKEKGHRK